MLSLNKLMLPVKETNREKTGPAEVWTDNKDEWLHWNIRTLLWPLEMHIAKLHLVCRLLLKKLIGFNQNFGIYRFSLVSCQIFTLWSSLPKKGQHSGGVDNSVSSQQESPLFKSAMWSWPLCGVCMFSPSLWILQLPPTAQRLVLCGVSLTGDFKLVVCISPVTYRKIRKT